MTRGQVKWPREDGLHTQAVCNGEECDGRRMALLSTLYGGGREGRGDVLYLYYWTKKQLPV